MTLSSYFEAFEDLAWVKGAGMRVGITSKAGREPDNVIASTYRQQAGNSLLYFRHETPGLVSAKSLLHFRFHATVTASLARKTFSTPASSFVSSAEQHSNKTQHAHTLTALHTARELVTRVLPQSSESLIWNEVLRDVSDETSRSNLTAEEDKISIVVYAVDEFSGGEALVSALLQDPFLEAENARITSRWEGREQDTRLDVEYTALPIGDTKGDSVDSEGAPPSPTRILRLSSSILASLPSPVRLTELRPSRELSQDHLKLLYTSHIPIIIINPLTAPLATLSPQTTSNTKPTVFPYRLPPHALLLITSPSPISTSSSIPPAVFELGVRPDRVFFVDPARALSSIRALRTNPTDALHVQRYADDSLGSGLSTLKRQLQSIPTSTQKGDGLVSATVGMLRNSLSAAEAELGEAIDVVRALRSETARARGDAQRAVFGPHSEALVPDTHTQLPASHQPPDAHRTGTAAAREGARRTGGIDSENSVRAAMTRANRTIQPILDNLTWWRVLWAPDEVPWRMQQATRDAWIGNITTLNPRSPLEPSPLRQSLTPENTTLHRTAQHTEQLAHAPSFVIEPRVLLAPLHRRLARLDEGSTTALARAAQIFLVRVVGSVGAGIGTGVLVLTHGMGEAAGAGLLVTVAGVRWAIGKWDKMRKAWNADWVRVQEAAERDVQVALDQALETQVLVVPVRAAEGVEEIIARRQDEIVQLRQDVDKLDKVSSNPPNPSG
ncbi:hypothetical protein B0F90DRAFT_1669978 [Multifurca ochricompacta]|uniref:Uncharacterized protein n=1 Tax=Multifurca ochricompacta TaxID=376703 RepID=A0AAD4QJY0_9AGAM|nr:hypothetical protein B0F90DRAFT_1669978 [Multifurca ochricompacta]